MNIDYNRYNKGYSSDTKRDVQLAHGELSKLGYTAGRSGGELDQKLLDSLGGIYNLDWLRNAYTTAYEKGKKEYTARNPSTTETEATKLEKALALIAAGQSVSVLKNPDGTLKSSSVPVNYDNNEPPSEVVEEELKEVKDGPITVGNDGNMSFEQYLAAYGGVDVNRQYADNVRRSNNDFYRSLLTYGKNAEAIAGKGLVGSGASSYGNDVAYAARQGAINTAEAIRADTDTAQKASYAQYLINQQSAKKAEEESAKLKKQSDSAMLLENALKLGLTDNDSLTKFAQSMGIDPAYVNDILPIITKYSEDVDAANREAEDKRKADEQQMYLNNAQNQYNTSRQNGLSHETAIAQLEQSRVPGDVISQIADNYKENMNNEVEYSINRVFESPQYSVALAGNGEEAAYISKAWLDQQCGNGSIEKGSEEYNEHLARIQSKNAESINKLLDGAHENGAKGYGLEEVCKEYGIDLSGVDVNDEDSMSEVAAQVITATRDRVVELYRNGDISEAAYADFLIKDIGYEVDGKYAENPKNAIRDIVYSIDNVYSKLAQYSDASDDVIESLYDEAAAVILENVKKVEVKANKVGGTLGIEANGIPLGSKIDVTTSDDKVEEIVVTYKIKPEAFNPSNIVFEQAIDKNNKFVITNTGEIGKFNTKNNTIRYGNIQAVMAENSGWGDVNIKTFTEIIARVLAGGK